MPFRGKSKNKKKYIPFEFSITTGPANHTISPRDCRKATLMYEHSVKFRKLVRTGSGEGNQGEEDERREEI